MPSLALDLDTVHHLPDQSSGFYVLVGKSTTARVVTFHMETEVLVGFGSDCNGSAGDGCSGGKTCRAGYADISPR